MNALPAALAPVDPRDISHAFQLALRLRDEQRLTEPEIRRALGQHGVDDDQVQFIVGGLFGRSQPHRDADAELGFEAGLRVQRSTSVPGATASPVSAERPSRLGLAALGAGALVTAVALLASAPSPVFALGGVLVLAGLWRTFG